MRLLQKIQSLYIKFREDNWFNKKQGEYVHLEYSEGAESIIMNKQDIVYITTKNKIPLVQIVVLPVTICCASDKHIPLCTLASFSVSGE